MEITSRGKRIRKINQTFYVSIDKEKIKGLDLQPGQEVDITISW
jgi:hypothetical protein